MWLARTSSDVQGRLLEAGDDAGVRAGGEEEPGGDFVLLKGGTVQRRVAYGARSDCGVCV